MGEGRKRKLSVAVERAVLDEAALVLDTFGQQMARQIRSRSERDDARSIAVLC